MPVSTTREERDRAIKALAKEYPKAFFVNTIQRKPLKLGIEKDIEADLAKADDNSPLLDYNIADAVAGYMWHVGYQSNCVAGTNRIDLEGRPVGKVTLSEAREAAEEAKEGFARIEARKQLPQFVTRSPPPPPPRSQVLPVKANLEALEMLAEIEKQIALVRSILGDDPDDPLRRELARPAMRLMIDELQTIIARQDQKAA
jgi:hypothetical protein